MSLSMQMRRHTFKTCRLNKSNTARRKAATFPQCETFQVDLGHQSTNELMYYAGLPIARLCTYARLSMCLSVCLLSVRSFVRSFGFVPAMRTPCSILTHQTVSRCASAGRMATITFSLGNSLLSNVEPTDTSPSTPIRPLLLTSRYSQRQLSRATPPPSRSTGRGR